MYLLKYDPDAKTLTEVAPGEFAADPACRYFYVKAKRAAVLVLTHDGIGEIVWEHPSYQPPSPTNQHCATDEQWAAGDGFGVMHACILELRDRIQQLESTQPPRLPAPAPAPSPRPSTLVDLVANAICNVPFNSDAVARAAIREVAKWLRFEAQAGPVGLSAKPTDD